MIGDVLRRKIYLLKNASTNPNDKNAFWKILRDIAKEEILENGQTVDSDIIIPLYYEICLENLEYIPSYYQIILQSNKQERFRVIIRNIFSSNSFHKEGLANQEGIRAKKLPNPHKKGEKIVFSPKGGLSI